MSQYLLAGRIESGELAELYRGTRDGAQAVVVKLFLPRTSDPAYAVELANTTRLLSVVDHPGLVSVFELGLVHGRLAVVMDDVGKVTLGQALTRLNTKEVLLAPGLAVALVLELLEAMQQAHSAGVMHGALTPGNVMLTPEGRCAIRDFGALKALFASKALARQFGSRGRSSYRAPENTSGDELSVESDIYSVAAIAYELLTLKEASTGESNVSTRRGVVPPPSRVDRRLNPRLDPIILRALDQTPSRRYRSANDFASALREFLSANGGLPSRDEHKRFVNTLFPAEVNIEHLGPAVFTEPFTLDEVTGANLAPLEEKSLVLDRRMPFSGGELDASAPTQDHLPVLDVPPSEEPGPTTLPELPRGVSPVDGGKKASPMSVSDSGQFPSWDAPAGAAPLILGQVESDSGTRALERRVRVIEDFQALDRKRPAPSGAPSHDAGPIPSTPRERLVLPTSEVPFVPDESLLIARPAPSAPSPDTSGPRRLNTEERAIRSMMVQRLKYLGWAMAVAVLATGVFYYVAVNNTDGRIIPTFRPVAGLPQVKAPPFRPDLRAPEPKGPDKARETRESKEQREQVKEPCFDGPPKKRAAFLTVTPSRGMTVRVDGVKICGNDFSRVAIEPGKRKITVIEGGKGGGAFDATQRFELGKEARVVPVFKSR